MVCRGDGNVETYLEMDSTRRREAWKESLEAHICRALGKRFRLADAVDDIQHLDWIVYKGSPPILTRPMSFPQDLHCWLLMMTSDGATDSARVPHSDTGSVFEPRHQKGGLHTVRSKLWRRGSRLTQNGVKSASVLHRESLNPSSTALYLNRALIGA